MLPQALASRRIVGALPRNDNVRGAGQLGYRFRKRGGGVSAEAALTTSPDERPGSAVAYGGLGPRLDVWRRSWLG